LEIFYIGFKGMSFKSVVTTTFDIMPIKNMTLTELKSKRDKLYDPEFVLIEKLAGVDIANTKFVVENEIKFRESIPYTSRPADFIKDKY